MLLTDNLFWYPWEGGMEITAIHTLFKGGEEYPDRSRAPEKRAG